MDHLVHELVMCQPHRAINQRGVRIFAVKPWQEHLEECKQLIQLLIVIVDDLGQEVVSTDLCLGVTAKQITLFLLKLFKALERLLQVRLEGLVVALAEIQFRKCFDLFPKVDLGAIELLTQLVGQVSISNTR